MNRKKIIAIILLIVIGTVIFWKREWIKQKLGLNKEELNKKIVGKKEGLNEEEKELD